MRCRDQPGNIMIKRIACIAAAVTLAAPAFANEAVLAVYRAGVAAQNCDVTLSGDQSSALADVISRKEQASGLSAGDLEALWNQTLAESDADKTAFCAKNTAAINKLLK
jgi:hypothetical protein